MYSMPEEFRLPSATRIPGWLLRDDTPVPVEDLARILSLSPEIVRNSSGVLEELGLITEKSEGTGQGLFLNGENPVVSSIRTFAILCLLWDAGLPKIAPGAASVALYGCAAEGRLEEDGELGILIIGGEQDVDQDVVRSIEEKTAMTARVRVISRQRFDELKEAEDPVLLPVIENHLLVRGQPL